MKSKVLVKLVLVFLLVTGTIVLLGTKAMVSAQGMYGLSPFPGEFRWSNDSVFEAYGAKVPKLRSYDVFAVVGGPLFTPLSGPSASCLSAQPKLTSTPSVSGNVIKSAGLTPLLPLFIYRNENEVVLTAGHNVFRTEGKIMVLAQSCGGDYMGMGSGY